MSKCDEFQEQLIELGDPVAVDANLNLHLKSCDKCQQYLQAHILLTEGCARLPELNASDELVAATLSLIEEDKLKDNRKNKSGSKNENIDVIDKAETKRKSFPWSGGLAASIMAFSLIGLHMQGHLSIPDFRDSDSGMVDSYRQEAAQEAKQETRQQARIEKPASQSEHFLTESKSAPPPASAMHAEMEEVIVLSDRHVEDELLWEEPEEDRQMPLTAPPREKAKRERKDNSSGGRDRDFRDSVEEEVIVTGIRASLEKSTVTKRHAAGVVDSITAEDIGRFPDSALAESLQRLQGVSIPAASKMNEDIERVAPQSGKARTRAVDGSASPAREKYNTDTNISNLSSGKAEGVARQYLADTNSQDNLSYQRATGYWANSYLPTDPEMRWLGLELQQKDLPRRYTELLTGVVRNRQPFDKPSSSALAVYLQADKKSINGKSRLKMQVGVQASERQSGQRSNMNLGLLIDISHKNSIEDIDKLKAILLALLEAKQAGDKFSLTIIASLENFELEPEEFKHGHIQVLLNQLYAQAKSPINAEARSLQEQRLHQGLRETRQWLHSVGDPRAALGANMILLATNAKFTTIYDELEAASHELATESVNLSTLSLGPASDRQQLDSMAMAGQGHSRVLQNAEQAQQLINQELFASSRSVARALRLSIRLAKGVKLIDVLGSHPLSEEYAERVRRSEESIDQSLYRSLGIAADRGNDEDGIQIVIPNFYSGDTHVILLDLMVEGPGDIADVSLRYKDILYLRNGVSHSQFAIPSGRLKPGLLELNVQKNQLSRKFASSMREFARLMNAGEDKETILAKVRNLSLLYQGLRKLIPLWRDDAELLRDERILLELSKILEGKTSNAEQLEASLVSLLEYASWIKWNKENAISGN